MLVSLKHYSSLLVRYLAAQRLRVLVMAVLLLASIGLQLANPQILRSFIDTAISGGSAETLTSTALLFLVVGLVTQVVSALASYVSTDVGWRATNQLRADLAQHCLALDMSFHTARTPGELIERIDGDVTALANFFSQFVVRVLGSLGLLAGVLVLLFREEWHTGLAATLFALVVLAVLLRVRRIAVAPIRAERQASAHLFGFLEERIAGLPELRSNGAGAYVMRRLYQLMRDLFTASRRARMLGGTTWVISMSLFALGYVLALGIGGYLFMAGAITIGTVYLFFQYTEMLQRPLEQLSQQIEDFQRSSASIARVQELFQIAPPPQAGRTAHLPSGPLAVEFDDVSFAYGTGEPALRQVSFQLEPGTLLGLLGRTGSGKTTIARLLARLHEPSQGTIRVGGCDLAAVGLEEVRRRIGVVTQDVQLFRSTVRDNLTFFDRSIPDEQIMQVLRDLGLMPWYQLLPDGLDTLLAGKSGLSAGEGQLLALARVFLKNPGLVILDEPSALLDPATEQMIERAMAHLLHNRTGIIIAHRLTTIQRADQILILGHGRVRELGRRESLARDPQSLFARQLRVGMSELDVGLERQVA